MTGIHRDTIMRPLGRGRLRLFGHGHAYAKLVPAYRVGKRDLPTATTFMTDLPSGWSTASSTTARGAQRA